MPCPVPHTMSQRIYRFITWTLSITEHSESTKIKQNSAKIEQKRHYHLYGKKLSKHSKSHPNAKAQELIVSKNLANESWVCQFFGEVRAKSENAKKSIISTFTSQSFTKCTISSICEINWFNLNFRWVKQTKISQYSEFWSNFPLYKAKQWGLKT